MIQLGINYTASTRNEYYLYVVNKGQFFCKQCLQKREAKEGETALVRLQAQSQAKDDVRDEDSSNTDMTPGKIHNPVILPRHQKFECFER